jgi:hypothetical protein
MRRRIEREVDLRGPRIVGSSEVPAAHGEGEHCYGRRHHPGADARSSEAGVRAFTRRVRGVRTLPAVAGTHAAQVKVERYERGYEERERDQICTAHRQQSK